MAYLDPASNPGSKPQRLGATNCKSSTSDKLQTFRTIFGISCKLLTKNYLHEITLFVLFWKAILAKSQNLPGKWKQELMIWEKIFCINGCRVISNLVISLVPYSTSYICLESQVNQAASSSSWPFINNQLQSSSSSAWRKYLKKVKKQA